jgi:pimeloyl-ACP methyl ester carboxylesterase
MEEGNAKLPNDSGYLSINGMQMYFEEYGDGYPLILLHGGASSSQTWQPFLPTFTPHFRVITPDSRAHGRSNNPAGVLSYRQMADDVATLIQALGVSHPLLFGYSDGGQVALELGMRYPGLCRALVVGAAWYKFSPVYLSTLKAAGFLSPGEVDFATLKSQSPDWIEEMKLVHICDPRPDYWQVLLKQISAMWWTPLDYTPEDFSNIVDPCLVMIGDRDGNMEIQQAVDEYRLIPNAELFIIPNAAHDTAKSDLSMPLVLDFLLRHRNQDI